MMMCPARLRAPPARAPAGGRGAELSNREKLGMDQVFVV